MLLSEGNLTTSVETDGKKEQKYCCYIGRISVLGHPVHKAMNYHQGHKVKG
jgi:hypothetical protein